MNQKCHEGSGSSFSRITNEETALMLREKRLQFTSMLADLLKFCKDNGYNVAIDMAKRCESCPVGHEHSLHKIGLATDLILYSDDGTYLTNEESYSGLGKYWESIGGSWGGRFDDFNHFSLYYNGMV